MSTANPLPTGTPADHLEGRTKNEGVEPTSMVLERGTSGGYKLKFFDKDNFVGWMGKDDHGWMRLVQNESEALNITLYSYGGQSYYKLDNGKYLSYGGTYNTLCDHLWNNATRWDFKDNSLIADNGNKVSYYSTDNGYLYANNGSNYIILDVQRV